MLHLRSLSAAVLLTLLLAGGLITSTQADFITQEVSRPTPVPASGEVIDPHNAGAVVELAKLEGHTELVHTVAFSPDGAILASAGNDREIRLWDVSSGEAIAVLRGHTGNITDIAFSPNGETLISGGVDGTLVVWDVASGEQLHRLEVPNVLGVAFHPDGSTFATGHIDGSIRLWFADTAEQIITWSGHATSIWDVAFSPDGRTLASAGFDRTIRLWSTETGQELSVLDGHGDMVVSVAFHPDEDIIASGGVDSARLTNTDTGRRVALLQNRATYSVAFNPGGAVLAGADPDGTIRLWNYDTQGVLATLSGHEGAVWDVAWSPDSSLLVSVGEDSAVHVWGLAQPPPATATLSPEEAAFALLTQTAEAATATPSPSPTLTPTPNLTETVRAIMDTVLTETAATAQASAPMATPPVMPLEAWTPVPTATLPPASLLESLTPITAENVGQLTLLGQMGRGTVDAIAWSPDDTILAAAGTLGVWLYDANDFGAPPRLIEEPAGILHMAFSPDGTVLAADNVWLGEPEQLVVKLWDVETGHSLGRLEVGQIITGLAFHPNGRVLAVRTSRKTIQMWNVAGQENAQVAVLQSPDSIKSLVFGQQGETTFLAAGNADGSIQVWEVDDDGQATEVASNNEHSEEATTLAFAGPDLVIGTEDGAIRRWSFGVDGAVESLREPDEEVHGTLTTFGARGILVVGGFNVIHLLYPEDYANQTTLEGTGRVYSVALSSDGRILAVSSGDGALRLWNVGAGEELVALTDFMPITRDIALSPSDDVVASANVDSKVRLWWLASGLTGDFYTGSQIGIFTEPYSAAWSVAFSPNNSTLASGDGMSVLVWDVGTSESRPFGVGAPVYSIAFSPDGSLIAASGGRNDESIVKVWHVDSRDEVFALETDTEFRATVLFGHTGDVLITGGAAGDINNVQVWDIETGEELASFEGHTAGVLSLALSPNATVLASGSNDNTVRLWDMATGEALAVLEGHTSRVDALAFSPDGSLLASGSRDKSIRLWDVETGEMLAAREDLAEIVVGLAFTSGGEVLVSGATGTIQLWGIGDSVQTQ